MLTNYVGGIGVRLTLEKHLEMINRGNSGIANMSKQPH